MRQERELELNKLPESRGEYVLYWMRSAVRSDSNLCLDWAIDRSNELKLPLLVLFCLVGDYPGASPVHYEYLRKGLAETEAGLQAKGIRFIVAKGKPETLVPRLASRSVLLVCEGAYLAYQRNSLVELVKNLDRRAVLIEGELCLPPRIVSGKEEWSAYTLRRRLMPILDSFLDIPQELIPKLSSLDLELLSLPLVDLGHKDRQDLGTEAPRYLEQVIEEEAGHSAALNRFEAFLENKIDTYHRDRNDPNLDGSSLMSASLHFGHVSAIELVQRTLKALDLRSARECNHEGAAAYIEELVVRRELAFNMSYYRSDADKYSCLPDWAQKTLKAGDLDKRENLYTNRELEFAETDDPYWNAAQNQMVLTGRMHGYMRMYWGKRLLAWTVDSATAFKTAVYLNDSYSLDGRDPNGYAGIAWCFGKHDRPWIGRPIYGTVRFMNAKGLKRKFDADGYVKRIAQLKEDRCSTI